MSTPSSTAAPARARLPALVALQNRDFRFIWSVNCLWQTAAGIETTVLGWLVLEMTDSAWAVALVGFFRWLPMLVLGMLSGVLADRVNRQRVLVATQLCNLTVAAGVLALVLTDMLQPGFIYLGSLIMGMAWTLDFPSRRSYVSVLLGPKLLAMGVALESMGFMMAKMLGPAIGGSLFDLGGGPLAYGVLTAIYVVTVQLVLRVRPEGKRPPTSSSIARSLSEGIAYVRHKPLIIGVLAATFVLNLLVFPYMQLLPVMARDVLGIGPALMGLLAAADGLGSLCVILIVTTRREVRRHALLFTIGCIGLLLGLLGFSLSRWYPLSFASLLLLGFGSGLFGPMQASTILLDSSPQMRGRAIGLLTLCIGGMPLGALLMGALARQYSAPTAMLITSTSGLIAMVAIIVFNRLPWRLPTEIAPPPPPPEPAAAKLRTEASG